MRQPSTVLGPMLRYGYFRDLKSGPKLLIWGGPDDVARLYGYVNERGPSGRTVSVVAVGVPAAAILVHSNSVLTMAMAMGGGTAVVSLLAAWLLGSVLITRRVHRLALAADTLSRGGLGATTGLPHSPDELGLLATTFNALLDRVANAFDQQRRFICNIRFNCFNGKRELE